MEIMQYMLVQNDGAHKSHVYEHLYSDFAKMVNDLATGEDNYWTIQVLSLDMKGDKISSMGDITDFVAECVAEESWDMATKGRDVHPLTLSYKSLAKRVEDIAEIERIRAEYFGCKMPRAVIERLEELGDTV
jgi:hypothetical protein